MIALVNCAQSKEETTSQVVDVENNENQKDTNVESGEVKSDSSENEIAVTWFNNPPHIFIDKESGKLTGAIYKLLEEIAPKINVKFNWMEDTTSIPRQLELIENNEKKYVGALIVKTPDREKLGVFSEKNFFFSQTALAVKKDNPLSTITKIEDILNLKIGYAKSTFISPFMTDKRVNFDLISSGNFMKNNFQKLSTDRIDAVYAPDKAGLLVQIKNMNLENDVKILNLPENKSPFHFLFSKSANDTAQKFNEYIETIDLEKIYLDFLSEYIDTSGL